jgi:U2 small nuclear ribonucleoprotein A'
MDGPSAARPAGSLGPRLAGRLTAELINRSPQYMNCVRHYEIDLRGKLSTTGLAGAAAAAYTSWD